MYFSQEPVPDRLRDGRKVHVEKLRVPGIDAFAQVGIRLVRRAKRDGVCPGKRAIEGFPVEAPVMTPTLNGFPAVCSSLARSAMANGTAFGDPAGVKPLKPIVSPSEIMAAASAAVSFGNGRLMVGG
jgi:hypothetical protein